MIKFEHTEVMGWEGAIRGARNPMNSHEKSDSYWTHIEDERTLETAKYEFFIGEKDLELLTKLAQAGSDHGKFLRQIFVSVDITAPLYYFKEFDTYKVGTVANSCSTMHKIHSKPLEISDFSLDDFVIYDDDFVIYDGDGNYIYDDYCFGEMFEDVMNHCEFLRQKYVETKDKKYWRALIQLLPSSYNQKRTVTLNYEVLRNMYHARKNHKLDEWLDACSWIESLPYAEELITSPRK